MLPNRLRRLVERFLPWYSADLERDRDRKTEELRLRSIRARIAVEHIRDGYASYAERLGQ
jgi:hypothetical protein